MMVTSFWHPDGTPMSAQQFMEVAVWQAAGVLQGRRRTARPLERAGHTQASCWKDWPRKGFGSDQLAEMQKIIDAEKSDLFDVLAYVAYALPTADPRGAGRHGPKP